MKAMFVKELVIFSVLCNSCFGNCDWTTIKKNSDGTYTYSAALNLCVGNLVKTNQTQAQEISDLNKAISLKDLSIQASDAKATLWSNTSASLESRLQAVDSLEKHNEFWYFVGGVLTTFAGGYVAAKLVGK